jgi:hypothetical protein
MADPPGKSATDKTEYCETSTIESNVDEVCDNSIWDKNAVTMQAATSATTTITVSNVASKDPLDISSDEDTTILASALSDLKLGTDGKPLTITPTSEEDAVVATAPADPIIFPWARLSGELRNQIYRAYFDIFQEEKKNEVNFVAPGPIFMSLQQMAPMFLNLLQADRKIRSEAAPIFYEEYLPFDCFNPSIWLGSSSTLLWRIQALSSLVALRDVHMRVSILYLTDTGDSEDFRVGIWIARYISRVKGQPILTDQSYTCACGEECGGWAFDRTWCWYCNDHCTYERRIGDNFLVRYQGDYSTSSGKALFIEGPLAELDWSGFVYRHGTTDED